MNKRKSENQLAYEEASRQAKDSNERSQQREKDELEHWCHEREEEGLEVNKQALDRADKAYYQSWVAIAIAGLSAVIAIVIALLKIG